jgi:uncharacterized integral membrane protein
MKSTDAEPGRIERVEDDGVDTRGRVSNGRSGPSIALVLFLIVVAYAVAFFFRNSHETTVDFVFGDTDTTLRWSLLLAVALGILLDRLVSVWWRAMRRRRR